MPRTARPRVEGDREEEILGATLELLLDVGYDRLTMDAVARRAHASKATLYRRWESKPRLVVQALAQAESSPQVLDHDTGSLRGDLIATFCGHEGPTKMGTEVLGSVVTALATDPEFATEFRAAFIEPKVAVNRGIYERAQRRGEIGPDVDVDVIGPALAGILLHRVFVLGLPTEEADVRRVIDHVILPAVQHPPRRTRS